MKCILIGSDNDILENIETYLHTNFFYIKVSKKANSFEEGKKNIKETKPNLIILDASIDTEKAQKLLKDIARYRNNCIVIIHPENQDLIEYLKKREIPYITKPIDTNELKFCISTIYLDTSKEIELQQILTRIRNTAPKKRLAIPQEKQILMISTNEILYIEADINYCQINIKDKKPILVSKTLKSFEQQLVNNPEFYRIHQSYLINLNYINKVIKTKLPQVIMTNGDILTISRSKKTEFLKLILN